MKPYGIGAILLSTIVFAGQVHEHGLASTVAPDGSVEMNAVTVPISSALSPEARAYMRSIIVDHRFGRPQPDIRSERLRQDQIMGEFLRPMLARYDVKISEQYIAGVFTQVVTPSAGISAENRSRVLLNVHGGGFTTGGRTASLVESLPLAALMGIKVISIDYRMSPEFEFPAASEDVTSVYREVLKTYRPAGVGLYGCSAGGLLTAQAIAWFDQDKLPAPGAIGVFCAGLGGFFVGDSPILGAPLNGIVHPMSAPPPADSESANAPASVFGYLASVARTNPLAYPLNSPELLAKFPPTLFISATRGFEFSAALVSHNALAKAGVESRLFAWDGLNHGFFYNSELPESRDAYDIMVRFFDDHLETPESEN